VETDGDGVTVLGREECLQLLGGATIGRLAVTVDALPTVVPVTFRLVDRRLLVRTGPGPRVAAAYDAVVAFEADDFDPADRTGWSVVVIGVAREVRSGVDADADAGGPTAAALDPDSWPSTPDGRLVTITTEVVSGHRVTAHAGGGRPR
jgi:hypothetical protein